MTKNILKYFEKFQCDIIKRYYLGNSKMCYFDYKGINYYTDGYIIYKLHDEVIKLCDICEYASLDGVVTRAEENNTHKLRYNGMNKDRILIYLTDSNIEVYIDPKLLKLFDKPEELTLYCDGKNRTAVTVKSDNVTLGYVLPMRANK